VPPGMAALITDPWERKLAPQSGHEARYSLPIALAARLTEGAVTPASFAEAPAAAIVERARRISARPMQNADFPNRFEARIHVSLAGGVTREVYVDDVFGGARRPPPRDAVLNKFRANAALIGRDADVLALEAAVLSVDEAPVSVITRALRAFRSVTVARAAE